LFAKNIVTCYLDILCVLLILQYLCESESD